MLQRFAIVVVPGTTRPISPTTAVSLPRSLSQTLIRKNEEGRHRLLVADPLGNSRYGILTRGRLLHPRAEYRYRTAAPDTHMNTPQSQPQRRGALIGSANSFGWRFSSAGFVVLGVRARSIRVKEFLKQFDIAVGGMGIGAAPPGLRL